MELSFWYWLIIVLWFLGVAVFRYRVPVPGYPYYHWFSGHLAEFILFCIIGLKLFGSPFSALVK